MSRRFVLYAYLSAVAASALAVVGFAVVDTSRLSHSQLNGIAITCGICAVLAWGGSLRQVLVSESSNHAMGTSAQIAALILIPNLGLAILTIAVAKFLSELSNMIRHVRRRWRATLLNSCGTLLANAAAGAAFHALGGNIYIFAHDWRIVEAFGALAALAFLYQTVDLGIVTLAITLTSKERPSGIFVRLGRDTLVPELSLVLVGVIFAVLYHENPWLSLFVLVPFMLSIRSFESIAKLRRETTEAVLRMAESIDYRDTGTYEHSKRLADLTRRLAHTLELTPEHTADIVLASRVHDLGKIGISNDILLKQGSLAPDERELMKQHPIIGASILSSYSVFKGSVDIVMHHHERWDGDGYPSGLKGEAIPLGSRMITVVDSFDSMTADRPYRRGMSVDDAVERLKRGIGSQFDPKVCGAFIHMLIEEGLYSPNDAAPDLRVLNFGAI